MKIVYNRNRGNIDECNYTHNFKQSAAIRLILDSWKCFDPVTFEGKGACVWKILRPSVSIVIAALPTKE